MMTVAAKVVGVSIETETLMQIMLNYKLLMGCMVWFHLKDEVATASEDIGRVEHTRI